MPKHIVTITFFTLLFWTTMTTPAFAQDIGNDTAIGVTINEKDIKDGDIITSANDGYKRSTKAYDPFMFGVASFTPSLYLEDEASKLTPILTHGNVPVRVSTLNGNIKKGDFITSSTIPGVGQKAVENGVVVGRAEEAYTEKDPKKIGTIYVTLNIHFAQLSSNVGQNVWKAVNLGANAALQTPLGALRYVTAGIIALLSFFFGFRFFGKASRSGVEAIGRNPLASKAILFSVAINASITIAIMFLGVAIAYLILVL